MSHSSQNITNAKLRIFFKVTKKILKRRKPKRKPCTKKTKTKNGFHQFSSSLSLSDVQLPVSETLNAPTGALNTVQAEGAVRCTIRCDVQLSVSETLDAPTGAHNTVQATGAVRCRQRNPPVGLSKTGDKVKYRPIESAAMSSDVASLREAGGWVHTYTTLRLRLVWCYARLRRG